MTFPDVIPAGRSSITDTDEWRDFCLRAAQDLSLLTVGETVFRQVIGKIAFAEERYLKVARELETLFGVFDGWQILEVGGGYGGQARVMLERHPRCTYRIVDLPEARRLQDAYLAEHGLALSSARFDRALFVSNYALTEMTPEWQLHYLAMARLCERGYVLWNGHTLDAFTRDEFAERAPPGRWVEQEFLHPENACYVWGEP